MTVTDLDHMLRWLEDAALGDQRDALGLDLLQALREARTEAARALDESGACSPSRCRLTLELNWGPRERPEGGL